MGTKTTFIFNIFSCIKTIHKANKRGWAFGSTHEKIDIEIKERNSFITTMFFLKPYHNNVILNLISYVYKGIDVRSQYSFLFAKDMFK